MRSGNARPGCRTARLRRAVRCTFRKSYITVWTAKRRPVHLHVFPLQICESNDARRLAMNARNFYITAAYGALQEELAGFNLNVYAPASFTKRYQLNAPASRLQYDPARLCQDFCRCC